MKKLYSSDSNREQPKQYLHEITKPAPTILDRSPKKKETMNTAADSSMFLGKRPYIAHHDELPPLARNKSITPLLKYVGVVVGLVVMMVLITSYVFGRAQVMITPYIVDGNVDMVLSAHESATESGVHFETMALDRTLARTVSADGVEENTARASGTIVIFNKETQEQNFREETRFQSSGGLIYKLGKGAGVRVPGAHNGVPGSVEVTVYADQPGAQYNIAESDFVIPGWKEIADPRFETQYARSKSAFTGGGTGQRPRISQTLLDQTITDLKKILSEQLLAQAAVEIPEGFVFFSGGLSITFDEPKIEPLPDIDTEASISLTARAHAYLFEESTLAQELVTALMPAPEAKTEDSEITETTETRFALKNPENLIMTWSPQTELSLNATATSAAPTTPVSASDETAIVPETTVKQIRFRLKGEATVHSFIDIPYLQEQLTGKTLEESKLVFMAVPEIAKASVSLRPMWKSHFPKNKDSIHIDTQV